MYDFALTENQQRLAAEKHNVLMTFLERNRLPMDEYYDVVVFDFLRAVRMYDDCDVKTSFETIAYSCMAKAIKNHCAYEAHRREAEIFSLDAPSVIGSKVEEEFLTDRTDLCDLISRKLCGAPDEGAGISHISHYECGFCSAAA